MCRKQCDKPKLDVTCEWWVNWLIKSMLWTAIDSLEIMTSWSLVRIRISLNGNSAHRNTPYIASLPEYKYWRLSAVVFKGGAWLIFCFHIPWELKNADHVCISYILFWMRLEYETASLVCYWTQNLPNTSGQDQEVSLADQCIAGYWHFPSCIPCTHVTL